MLDRAFARCDAITREHSKTFYFASALLPKAKRRGARALYAFCRETDDVVDRGGNDIARCLEQWRRRALAPAPPPDDLVPLAWAHTRAAYRIPDRLAEQLIEGVARDLSQTRYRDFSQLAEYCYGVASTVGLMSMHIMGFAGPEAIPYAVKMGVALQMTNILRDVGEDWQRGRVYLPEDELARFGISESDLAAGRVDDRWRRLMRFQIERTHRLYDESWPGIALLHRDGQFSIAAAADLYRAILGAIEINRYDVFRRRAHIGLIGKLMRLPRIRRRLRSLRNGRLIPY
ncbi:MAG: phytoene/squalene synthase family protein [Candidatus Sumerlaeia bacterium]|nr:phytoene/squalene synthase family protein [Candidatus Sumerlaeia bacterium]